VFVNIHSHNNSAAAGITIQSLYKGFEQVSAPGWFSAGLHPWYIIENGWQNDFEALAKAVMKPTVIAVGECGLDKICPVNFALQKTVFAAQIHLANRINKPLIIHCVKAFDEVLKALQQQHNKVPVIFHGFNKSKEMAQQLINKGCYLSFGKALQQQRLQQVIQTAAASKIFLETDNAAVSIQDIYGLAAAALQIDINTLSLQLQKNALAVFGSHFI
jgi:TatD DNase family protein